MLPEKVAERYAEALFSLASEKEKVEDFKAELERVVEVFAKHEDLNKAFNAPHISPFVKRSIAKKLFEGKVLPELLAFLLLLVDKKREKFLPAVAEKYQKIFDESVNSTTAVVTLASDIPENQKVLIARTLSAYTKKDVRLEINTDPSILGGIIVRIGDTLIDGSLRHSIEGMKDMFLKQQIS